MFVSFSDIKLANGVKYSVYETVLDTIMGKSTILLNYNTSTFLLYYVSVLFKQGLEWNRKDESLCVCYLTM